MEDNGQEITIESLQKQLSELQGNYDKLKETNSKTNSEMAEYKRQEKIRLEKEKEKLSNEEKTNLELEDLRKQVSNYALKDSLLAQGYTAKEVEKLMADNCSPKVYAEIMADRMKEQEKSLKAEQIVKSTPQQPLGNKGGGKEETLAQKLAKENIASTNKDAKSYYNK